MAFFKAKSQNGKSGSNPSSFPFYDIIDSFMGECPIADPEDNGVDVGFPEDLPSEDMTNSPGKVDLLILLLYVTLMC